MINNFIEFLKKNKFVNKIMESNIMRNSLITFSSQSIAGILSFICTLIIVRSIGMTGNGILSIVIAYSALFNGLFNFQSYNALIKFGAETKEKNDKELYKFYIKMAFIQDIITACIAMVVGYLCLDFASAFMHWDGEVTFLVKIYLITIIVNVTGSLNAILRLNNEFHITGLVAIISNAFKLFFLIIAMFLNSPIIVFVIIEIITLFIQNILRAFYVYKSLKKQDLLNFLSVKLVFDKEFTKFNVYNNLVTAVDIPTGQAVSLIINKILGFEIVGIYNLFIKIGAVIGQITDAIGQAILPEFSLLVARNQIGSAIKVSKKLLMYVNLAGVCISLFALLTYQIWMPFLMDENLFNAIAFAIYIIFLSFSGSIVPIHMLFISANFVRFNLIIVIICNLIYLFLLVFMGMNFSLIGIMVAMLIQSFLVFTMKIFVLKRNNLWI